MLGSGSQIAGTKSRWDNTARTCASILSVLRPAAWTLEVEYFDREPGVARVRCSNQARYRSGSRGLALNLLFQGVQEATHAPGAPGRELVAVEERTLLGEDQAGAVVAHGSELHRRQRDRDPRLLQAHVVGVDDALGRNDVLVERLVAVGLAIRRGAPAAFPPADAEVELETCLGVDEPACLGLRIGPRRECTLGRHLVPALDDKGGVLHRSSAHRLPIFGSSLPSARYSPRRSSRDSQLDRRAPIHRSTGRSAAGSIRHVRTRPTFSELTRPLTCSTSRCWTTADSDIGIGSASSLTVAGPRLSRSTMPLLLGSASA